MRRSLRRSRTSIEARLDVNIGLQHSHRSKIPTERPNWVFPFPGYPMDCIHQTIPGKGDPGPHLLPKYPFYCPNYANFTWPIPVFVGISFNQSKGFLKKKINSKEEMTLPGSEKWEKGSEAWGKGWRGHGGVVRIPNPTKNLRLEGLSRNLKSELLKCRI